MPSIEASLRYSFLVKNKPLPFRTESLWISQTPTPLLTILLPMDKPPYRKVHVYIFVVASRHYVSPLSLNLSLNSFSLKVTTSGSLRTLLYKELRVSMGVRN